MNERIEKLAEQVGLWNDMEPTRRSGRYVGHMNVADVEKFAELIVEEMYVFMCNSTDNDKPWPSFKEVKEHFGVEQ